MSTRSYRELIQYETFEDRFRYLMLGGFVGRPTFGGDRWLNQRFYTSREWRDLRDIVIARDLGCDLGIEDRPIFDRPTIHHMNPMTVPDIVHADDKNLDPEFLICVSDRTHRAIHYGDETQLPRGLVERKPGDTAPWKRSDS